MFSDLELHSTFEHQNPLCPSTPLQLELHIEKIDFGFEDLKAFPHPPELELLMENFDFGLESPQPPPTVLYMGIVSRR